jgi:hypothetical protein
MSKFYDAVGYLDATESEPGVWTESITERKHYGDVIRNSSMYQSTEHINDELRISNDFSIIADPYAYENFHKIKYVKYMGTKWKASSVEVQYPRLLIKVGGVYNEQTS